MGMLLGNSFGVVFLLAAMGTTLAIPIMEPESCEYEGMYCNFNHFYLDEIELEAGANYTTTCRQACSENADCKHFTWISTARATTCHLLTDCKEKRTGRCLELGTCESGPVDCSGDITYSEGCQSPVELDPEYIPWQCQDYQANILTAEEMAADILPVGSVCHLRCPAWKTVNGSQGILESTCGSDGEWGPTVTRGDEGEEDLTFPSGPYPSPLSNTTDSPAALMCVCQSLVLSRPYDAPPTTDGLYNPNREPGASFACTKPAEYSSNAVVITGDNDCWLYCDSHFTAATSCENGEWTGDIEKGFWCYKEPEVKAAGVQTQSSGNECKFTACDYKDENGNYPPNGDYEEGACQSTYCTCTEGRGLLRNCSETTLAFVESKGYCDYKSNLDQCKNEEIISFGPYGGWSGDPFTDEDKWTPGSSWPIQGMRIEYGDVIDGFRVIYSDAEKKPREGKRHGRKLSSSQEGYFDLDEDDKIIEIKLSYLTNHDAPTDIIQHLEFRTKKGSTFGPYGTERGTSVTVTAPDPEDCYLAYVTGRSGWYIDGYACWMGCKSG